MTTTLDEISEMLAEMKKDMNDMKLKLVDIRESMKAMEKKRIKMEMDLLKILITR